MLQYFEIFSGGIYFWPSRGVHVRLEGYTMLQSLRVLTLERDEQTKAKFWGYCQLEELVPAKLTKELIDRIDPETMGDNTVQRRFVWENEHMVRDRTSNSGKGYTTFHKIQMLYIADYGRLLDLKRID